MSSVRCHLSPVTYVTNVNSHSQGPSPIRYLPSLQIQFYVQFVQLALECKHSASGLSSPESLCLHSAACCTHSSMKLDL